MAYAPFKIPKSDSPLATLATVATLDPTRPQSVANVASVARGERENNASTPRSVATVATVARHIPKTENPAPVSLDLVAEPEPPEAAVARRLDEMAAENAARRDWWREPDPMAGSGKITMRSIVTGEEITIDLRTGRTQH